MESPNRLTRRNAIKILAAGGAALAATPLLVSAHGVEGHSNLRENVTSSSSDGESLLANLGTSDDPLVIMVRGNNLVGYRGEEEIRLADASLSSQLRGAFRLGRQ